jgi:endonuclease/exonuclease/phosphatase family metal-dependent hydrolase
MHKASRLRSLTATLLLVAVFLVSDSLVAGTIRITSWNLQWFPNGHPKETSSEQQAKSVNAVADVLRTLNPDIILLQEVRDYEICARLADTIQPNTYQVAISSAFKEGLGIGKQQVAILSKQPAQAAWSESWRSMENVDPPRGFAFSWFKIAGADIGVYSLHLKSNLIMVRNKALEGANNIRKREVAARQLIAHMRDVIAVAMPNVRSIIVGGDFNTDAEEFPYEQTIPTLMTAGFVSCFEKLPLNQRITHPWSRRYPDATFDYIFARNASFGSVKIISSAASDHLPVTCDVEIPSTTLATVLDSPKEITITRPVTIQIPYGNTVLPTGSRLHVMSRSKDSVVVQYMNGTYSVPIGSTDLREQVKSDERR